MSEGKPPLLNTITGSHLTSDECLDTSEVGVNIGGLAAIIVFYLAVLLVSIWDYLKQAGAELGQAQLKLGFDFTLR